MIEYVDRRVLAGFICADAITGNSVTAPLQVTSPGLSLQANRSSVYVVYGAPNLAAQTSQFLPVEPWPAAAAVEVTIQDPSLQYLPRRAMMQLPQDPALVYPAPPAAGSPAPAPWTLPSITLYPSASAPLAPNWAVVRASVVSAANAAGLAWAAVRLLRASDGTTLAAGFTDARGESLLAVPGFGRQVASGTGGSVSTTTLAVTVQAWFDPTVLTQSATWIPNPDLIFSALTTNTALKSATTSGTIGSGQIFNAQIKITL